MLRDEAPKAPVLLYAIENSSTISEEEAPMKYNLQEVSRSLWLGELSPNVDLVIPFDERSTRLNTLHKDILGGFCGFANDQSNKGLY